MEPSYDVIILGSGLAGLYAALELGEADPPVSVLVLSKQAPTDSGSSLAQGGVAAVLEQEDDSFALHAEDTLVAGNYQNDPAAVEVLVREGPEDVRRVMALGVEFDRDAQGELEMNLEGGHSRRRIVHHADQTGRELVDKLLPRVLALPGITLRGDATAYAARRLRGGFAVETLESGQPRQYVCRFLLLATGGIGRVYRRTTNPPISTGDGIRLAYELGAAIKNLRFVQFHPTAFDGSDHEEQFLISEAVRGEGAFLRNCSGERFLQRYDPRQELAPRDVVSRAIVQEARRTGSKRFYLDIRHRGRDFVWERFPGIAAACKERGYDMGGELIPVFPCQHYLMGGVAVNLQSRSTVPGLYAAGECAHTGLHGGNRLASNSLPEALVFSRRAAQDIIRRAHDGSSFPADSGESAKMLPPPCAHARSVREYDRLREEIQEEMQRAYFVFPDIEALPRAAKRMRTLYESLKAEGAAPDKEYAQILSLACVAALILEEAEEAL
ncbi:MAG: FAD-binding protein [Oscillospiraceae bacterium]|jgi:L-aspartate oxidase|nr:FAD-binding protein [Oscillospiraceae bacterium]